MEIEHQGTRPRIAADAYVAPNAVVCGDVTIGPGARILFGAVVTAEGGPVVLGERCIVMENAVVRGRERHPTRLGKNVLVGPHAHVNGAVVEDDVFIATGASIFPGAVVGSGSEVRIGAVVQVNTRLLPGSTVPIHWIAAGDPAQLFPPEAHDALWEVQRELDFPQTLFGVDRDDLTMERITRDYETLFGRHREDRVLD